MLKHNFIFNYSLLCKLSQKNEMNEGEKERDKEDRK